MVIDKGSKSQGKSSETNQDVQADHSTGSEIPEIKKSFHEKGTQRNVFGEYDYEMKYAEDPPGKEVDEYARVWLTYLAETEQYDRDKVEGWKNTIDVLLVFAGLFSTVITTFVIESTQNLQTDYTQASANLLFELVQIQRAVINGVPTGSISPPPINPNTPFVPSMTDSLVNALWFTSLSLALVTALLAVLTKQWLYHYSSLTYGTPREKSRLRQFRSQGLEAWKVAYIVQFLPFLLHTALALFLAGLVVFLLPLKTEIAWTVGVVSGIAYIFYVVSALLPLLDPQCPYTTILTSLFRKSWGIAHYCFHLLINLGLFYTFGEDQGVRTVTIKDLARSVTTPIWSKITAISQRCRHQVIQSFGSLFLTSRIVLWILEHILSSLPPSLLTIPLIALQKLLAYHPRFLRPKRPAQLRNDREFERNIVQRNGISIDTDAIYWLYSESTNPSARRIVNQSICALPYGINGHPLIEESLHKDLSEFVLEENSSTLQAGTLRRLILARLHYDDTINADVIKLLYQVLDSQKTKFEDSGFTKLYGCLTQDPFKIIINSINDTTTCWPLVVWSFLFRHAEYKDTLADPAAPQNALAKMLLKLDAAKNLFTWSDTKITPVSDQEPITLSMLSTKYPDIAAKWIFGYLSKHFRVSIDPKSLEFFVLGEMPYTHYSLFRTIYRALTQSNPPSDGDSLENDSRASLHSLVQSFKPYITFITNDESGWSDHLAILGRVFERDIMWPEVFFDNQFIMPETRTALIQIYNSFHKVYVQGPVRQETMGCIHDYLARLNAPPTEDSRPVALRLLTVVTLPRFCEFLGRLQEQKQDPRLDIVLIHSRQGMTGSHAKSFLSVYKRASRNPSTTLYKILYNPSVLEELCKCMVTAKCSGYLLDIARFDPSNSGWRDCYKRLLNVIQEKLRSFHFERLTSQNNPEDTNPPFGEVFREEWFSLYLLCYHLCSILKVDHTEAEFTSRELPDMFPATFNQLSPNQVRKFNALVLKKKKVPFSIGPFLRSLRPTLSPTIRVGNLDDKPSPV